MIVAVNDAWIKYGLNNGAQSTDPIGVWKRLAGGFQGRVALRPFWE